MSSGVADTRLDLMNEVVWDKDGGEGGCLMSVLTGIGAAVGVIAVLAVGYLVVGPEVVRMWFQ